MLEIDCFAVCQIEIVTISIKLELPSHEKFCDYYVYKMWKINFQCGIIFIIK